MSLKYLYPPEEVRESYIRAGLGFGDAVSILWAGEAEGFDNSFKEWASWEQEYVQRGFVTIDLESFVQADSAADLGALVGQRRENEPIVYHAQIFKATYERSKNLGGVAIQDAVLNSK